MTQDEVLIPKMKRLDEDNRKMNIPLLNLVLPFFCVLLLIGSTFINIDIRHYIIPSEIFSGSLSLSDHIVEFSIIPQIPVLMFICSSLGKKMGTSTVIIYLLCGLFIFPVFALGGGISYVTQYSFGYILAFIPAMFFAGSLLQKKYSFLYMFLAALTGVFTVHFLGVLYFLIVALIRQDSVSFIHGWINAQSGLKIIYDIVFSYVGILIGKYVNAFLKLILK